MTDVPYHVTPEFQQRIAGTFGAAGIAWLSRLPSILNACAERWSLTIGPPFELSYNYVAPVTRVDGSPAVLKVGCPNPELGTEAEALRLFAGDGVCELLEYEPDNGAMLLERVSPGVPLTTLALDDDERATSIAIDLFTRLWRPAPDEHSFPTVAGWARALDRHRQRFDGGTGPIPPHLFEEAETCFAWLLGSSRGPMLLHGDLHHDNIISATRAPWLIIDPKGVVGDPGFELGAFLTNPRPQILAVPDLAAVMARRVDQLSEGLGMERARVRGWGIAQAILSACWSVDDDEDPDLAITCAEHLAALKIA